MISTGICRWLFLLISLSTWTKLTESKEMRVVCYYTNWSVYRPGTAKFSPQNINPYLCTHLIYAFGGFTKENTLKPFDKYQDIEKGGYAKFTGLKTYNKNLKTLLAIGGWNEGSSRFSPMVASAERRKELVKNTVKFLRQNHFDGLDLDWEYPTFRDGGKSRDRDNYAQLVKELREEFERESEKTGRPRLLLTMAVPAGIEYINKGYDVPKLTKYLDWMNILSYDYHSAFEPAVNHHAPLYALEEDNEYNYDADLNIDHTIKHYMKMGADPGKLVLGIPTYGRSYTLFNPDATDMGAPADGPGDMGEATRENGYLAYYEICEYIKDKDWDVEEPNPDAMGPYAYKDNQWVGYDDENIVRKKAEYVAENSLGGIMFWAIDNDDFRGNCHGRPYPLIEAGKEALLNAYGIAEENLISPPTKPLKSKSKSRTRSKLTNPDEKKEVSTTTAASNSRRRRIKTKQREEPEEKPVERQTKRRNKSTKKQAAESSTYSSLKIVTPSYTTPAPPSTPDAGGGFKCEDEGFFPHPKDCKKYFWCLSGAGDTGIVAHQFTCPAGLFFNKAADSCDYSQNVLCNKKLQKATTSTTTEAPADGSTTSTPKSIVSSVFSSTRAPPKITAATSRTTFRQTTTTEAYEEEYEDDDEEYTDDEKSDSEEDPQVIKELLDLIKKAGGIEQLEKQLHLGGPDSSTSTASGSETPTKSPVTKSLYERVLSKTSKGTLEALKKTTTVNRNSRGPQSTNFRNGDKDRSKVDRGRLEYKTILRQRPSTEKPNEDEDLDDEEEIVEEIPSPKRLFRTKSTPEYTNIRRARVSTTTEPTDDSRNKILGEVADDETENEDSPTNNQARVSTPKYVNIRRQRPTTTERPNGSKYTDIRRTTSKPEENTVEDIENENKSRRGLTTASNPVEDTTSKYQTIRRSTTTQPTTTTENEIVTEIRTRGTTTPKTSTKLPEESNNSRHKLLGRSTTSYIDEENDVTAKYQTISRSTPTTASSINSTIEGINNTSTTRTVIPVSEQLKDTATILTGVQSSTESLLSSSNISSEHNALSLQSEGNSTDKNTLNDTTKNNTEIVSENRKESTVALSQPRPFSRVTTEPSSTSQASKVSHTNFKYRVRPNTASSESQGISTTPASTTVRATRVRGSSRFNLSKRRNIVENVINKNLTTSRTRKRPSTTTTEKNVDINEEQNRAFRPSELADFSSLTAVDFSKGKELDLAASRHRRRRPLNSNSATTTSTEKPEENLKTGSRTLPLARKLIDPSTFGKSRRITVNKIEDQANASSDLNIASTTKQVRGFRSTTPKSVEKNKDQEGSSTINSVTGKSSSRTRRIIRRFRTTTSSPATSEPNRVSTEKTAISKSRQSLFRTRQNQNDLSTTDSKKENIQNENPLKNLFSKKPIRLPFAATAENQTEANVNNDEVLNESSEEDNTEEDENIKLSESNIRESSDLNSFNVDGKQRRQFFKISPRQDSFYGKGYSNNDGKQNRESTTQKEETLEFNIRGKESTKFNVPTDSSVIVRRKLIRKFRPKDSPSTTESTDSENGENQNRRRKIIRRIRPANSAVNNLDTDESLNERFEVNPKPHIRGRPNTVTSRTITTEIVEEEHLVPTYYRKTSDDEDEERDSNVASSTPYISIEHINENDEYDRDEDHEPREYDHGENEDGDEPHYKTILRSTSINRSHHFESNTNFENENEEQDDEDVKDKDSLVKKVKNSMLHAKNETEMFVNENNPETENGKSKPDTNVETKEADTVKETPSESVNETTTKRAALLRPQNERPTFSRQKLIINKQETVKEIQKDTQQSAPRYRTLSRSSLTTATTITPALKEGRFKSTTNAYVSDDIVNTESTESVLEISTTGQSSTTEKTARTNPVQSATEATIINRSSIATTEISNEITKLATDSEGLLTTDNVVFNETVTASSSIPEDSTISESIAGSTSEIPLYSTTFESMTETPTEAIIKSSTINETGRTTESPRTSSSERSTETYRRSTLRSAENRPKLNLGRRPATSSSTTESTLSEPTRRSYRNRDKFNRNRLQKPTSTAVTEETSSIKSSTTAVPINKFILGRYSTTERSRFRPKPQKEKEIDDVDGSEDFEDDEDEIEGAVFEEKEEKSDEKPYVRPAFKPKSRFRQSSTRKPSVGNNPTSVNKFKKQKVVNKPPSFIRTTSEAPVGETPNKELEDVDTEAVKNRNKNLFTKRVMNTPFVGTLSTPSSSEAVATEASTSSNAENSTTERELLTDATTKLDLLTDTTTKGSSTEHTTELLTTLHHIFAEVGAGQNSTTKEATETSTEPLNLSTTSAKGKIERIIEVNRIVEVSAKEAKIVNHTKIEEPQTKIEHIPTFDKIGEITRVTVIKVVNGNGTNSTVVEKPVKDNEIKEQPIDGPFVPATVVEVPASEIQKIINLTDISLKLKLQEENKRQDRKFETNNQTPNNIQKINSGKAEIIDGRSHINIVTPKPFYSTEASTIALQALFKPESSTSRTNVDNFHSNDELLETERSEYVNVRVLKQDQNLRLDKGLLDDTKILPIRVLHQDEEEVTMKAHVVEVKPEASSGTIKIVPIRVEMSRKLQISPSVFSRVQKLGNAVPFVRNFDTGTHFVKPELLT